MTNNSTIDKVPSAYNYTQNNCTVLNGELFLWFYNEANLAAQLPAIYFTGFLMVFGVIGNIFVVYAYGIKLKRSSANIFGCALGIIDLLCCCISIPFEIFVLRFHCMNFNVVACKFFRGVAIMLYMSEGLMLICIAIDRYKKICRPLQSIRYNKPLYFIIFVVGLGIIFGWPAFFVFGQQTVVTNFPDIFGKRCSIDDKVRGTMYPTLFYCELLLLCVLGLVLIIAIYVNIFFAIHNWKKARDNRNLSKIQSASSLDNEQHDLESKKNVYRPSNLNHKRVVFYINDEEFRHGQNLPRMSSSNSTDNLPSVSDRENVRKTSSNHIEKKSSMVKTTIICVAVTITFILSYIPYIVIEIMLKTNSLVEENESLIVHQLLEVVAKSYCISNASNAVIYTIFDPKFRQACKELFCPQKLHKVG